MHEAIWEEAQHDEVLLRDLMEATSFSRPMALVLAQRGLTPGEAADFLRPALQQLSDPYLLPGTQEAAKRLWEAIHVGERILVHGDYDTDGITAAAFLAWALRANGADVDCFLPHRIDDGYGLTPESIDKATNEGHRLLVTVDCGVTSYDAVEAARARNLDVIITDHHTPGNERPNASAVVDPKLPGCVPAAADLAGVGVAFKVCHAFIKYGRENGLGGQETDLRSGLDLVAIGTVADIVPLLRENRLLVRHGLEVLSRHQRPGLHALCEVAGVGDVVRASDITYKLAPRLNAAGRMGDPADSLRLLESDSMTDASALARSLDVQNTERQQIEEAALKAAEAQIEERYDIVNDRSIVVWHENWHQGVIGIVASRLARRYHRPSVVLTLDASGQFTGSGRSIRHLDLVSLLAECEDTLTRFGGHAMAAGLSLNPDKLEPFCRSFEQAVRRILTAEAMKPRIEICGEVSLDEVSDGFFAELEQLEPFGHSNPDPVFLTRGVWPGQVDTAGQRHTRGYVHDREGARMNFIAFERTLEQWPEPPWSLVYAPQINRFAGRCTPQLRILDVRGG